MSTDVEPNRQPNDSFHVALPRRFRECKTRNEVDILLKCTRGLFRFDCRSSSVWTIEDPVVLVFDGDLPAKPWLISIGGMHAVLWHKDIGHGDIVPSVNCLFLNGSVFGGYYALRDMSAAGSAIVSQGQFESLALKICKARKPENHFSQTLANELLGLLFGGPFLYFFEKLPDFNVTNIIMTTRLCLVIVVEGDHDRRQAPGSIAGSMVTYYRTHELPRAGLRACLEGLRNGAALGQGPSNRDTGQTSPLRELATPDTRAGMDPVAVSLYSRQAGSVNGMFAGWGLAMDRAAVDTHECSEQQTSLEDRLEKLTVEDRVRSASRRFIRTT